MSYVLGVDGGNTKTDYLLHGLDGRLAAHLRGGTCSHEALGMAGAHREMEARIAQVLAQGGITKNEIAAAAFGLAGVDQAAQKRSLEAIVRAMGFENAVVMNDSFLGIKAGSETGVGVCSINGTGTASGGIDSQGKWVQVGGYGDSVSGDEGGGTYIARRVLRAAYDAAYRFGGETALLPGVCALLSCTPETLHDAVSIEFLEGKKVDGLAFVKLLFSACDAGDGEALGLVHQVADALARSAAGCGVRLAFDGPIPVVLIGSVWTKGRFAPMINHFKAQFEGYTKKEAILHILEVPPAAGSVLWALELALGQVPRPDVRERVFQDTRGL